MPEQVTQGGAKGEARRIGGGAGIVLVLAYGTLALAATGRSILQVVEYFDRAPLAYVLSAVAAVVYIVATWALLTDRRRLAGATIVFEAVGVLTVGVLSYVATDLFPDKTVWSHFGSGYGYLPLVLPFVGLWWLRRTATS
jgi:hypothetical protein